MKGLCGENGTLFLNEPLVPCSGLGGKLHGLYYAFGEHDVVVLLEAPDDQTAAAVSLGAAAPGHLKAIKTTVLLTPGEMTAALRKAGTQAYQAPS